MKNLKEFSLPIKGLKSGVHEFDFEIGNDFFKNFENSPIEEGNFNVHLTFDKHDAFIEMYLITTEASELNAIDVQRP